MSDSFVFCPALGGHSLLSQLVPRGISAGSHGLMTWLVNEPAWTSATSPT